MGVVEVLGLFIPWQGHRKSLLMTFHGINRPLYIIEAQSCDENTTSAATTQFNELPIWRVSFELLLNDTSVTR